MSLSCTLGGWPGRGGSDSPSTDSDSLSRMSPAISKIISSLVLPALTQDLRNSFIGFLNLSRLDH